MAKMHSFAVTGPDKMKRMIAGLLVLAVLLVSGAQAGLRSPIATTGARVKPLQLQLSASRRLCMTITVTTGYRAALAASVQCTFTA